MQARTTALIVAAGAGSRMGGEIPKQYAPIAGKAVLAHAIDALASHPAIDEIRVVIGKGQERLYADALAGRQIAAPVIGGATRRESVANGIAATSNERILIHDAARPFLPAVVIDRLLAALEQAPAAVPVLPVADTLAQVGADLGATVPRDNLARVQTPQAFHTDAIRAAHATWDPTKEATDDAQIARAAGLVVKTVEGSPLLDKLTFPADFAEAERRMKGEMMTYVTRFGTGFDVHAFGDGDHVWLGGVSVPHDRGVVAHSDGDVILHALTDAILGALADGDIGTHFPPSDPQWRGASSDRFLAHAVGLVRKRGGIVDHLDATLLCERPKLGPHRDAMRRRIAEIAGLRLDQVSLKATTTEKLGFTGRSEGIAAQAAATIRLPEDDS